VLLGCVRALHFVKKLAFLFHDYQLAFKARTQALPLFKAQFEFTIKGVTNLVTMQSALSIFGRDVWLVFSSRHTPLAGVGAHISRVIYVQSARRY
jgi:hypothetical protein